MLAALAPLLKSSATWIYVITVAGFLMYGSYQELKLNRAEKGMADWQARAQTAEQKLEDARGRLEALNVMLLEQEKALDKALAKRTSSRRQMAEAKKNDKAVADWSAAAVPDGVQRVLRGKGKKKR